MAKSSVAPRPKPFQWLEDFPTTAATCLVALSIVIATAVRYLAFKAALEDFGAWLTFLGSLVGITGATVVGKRFSTNPEVIAMENAGRQDPPPDVAITEIEGDRTVDVTPQPGATQTPPAG